MTPIVEGSLKQWSMLYMMERRLTIEEAAAVQVRLEDDPKLGYLAHRWELPASHFPDAVRASIVILVREKVLRWMDKYREGHSARCLFTGES